MKNEQQNSQGATQDQHPKNTSTGQRDNDQQQGNNKQQPAAGNSTSTKDPSSPSVQKSNISVNNDGKIGKAHDQWGNDQQNNQLEGSNDKSQKNNGNQHQSGVKNNKTQTEPGIDAPIDDPEKTEKKIPQMQDNKHKK